MSSLVITHERPTVGTGWVDLPPSSEGASLISDLRTRIQAASSVSKTYVVDNSNVGPAIDAQARAVAQDMANRWDD